MSLTSAFNSPWMISMLSKSTYFAVNTPDNFTKAEKANLRRQCRNNFQLADGVLKYRTTMKPGKEEEEWRVCIQTEEEKTSGKLPWRYNYG